MEKYITRMLAVDKLIKRKATGQPKELASKLQVSESTVYRILRLLKENMGLSIEFSEKQNSYIYRSDSEEFSFEKLSLTSKE
jgi:predicted DNA-binding transcriptional regulator YafY